MPNHNSYAGEVLYPCAMLCRWQEGKEVDTTQQLANRSWEEKDTLVLDSLLQLVGVGYLRSLGNYHPLLIYLQSYPLNDTEFKRTRVPS
jgi:hypothetical protein